MLSKYSILLLLGMSMFLTVSAKRSKKGFTEPTILRATEQIVNAGIDQGSKEGNIFIILRWNGMTTPQKFEFWSANEMSESLRIMKVTLTTPKNYKQYKTSEIELSQVRKGDILELYCYKSLPVSSGSGAPYALGYTCLGKNHKMIINHFQTETTIAN